MISLPTHFKSTLHAVLPWATLVAGFACTGGLETPIDEPDRFGSIQITVSTTGTMLDPDGYRVTLDEFQSLLVGINGVAVFGSVLVGGYQALLDEVASNCVVGGQNPMAVTVIEGTPSLGRFDIVCAAPAAELVEGGP